MLIPFEEFAKVDLRVAKILSAERVEGSEKLLKLQVDLGEKNTEGITIPRQILVGVGKVYNPEKLIGTEIIVVANLEPRMLMGLESQGMLLAAKNENGPVLLRPESEVESGGKIS